jgi:hypothetical protein
LHSQRCDTQTICYQRIILTTAKCLLQINDKFRLEMRHSINQRKTTPGLAPVTTMGPCLRPPPSLADCATPRRFPDYFPVAPVDRQRSAEACRCGGSSGRRRGEFRFLGQVQASAGLRPVVSEHGASGRHKLAVEECFFRIAWLPMGHLLENHCRESRSCRRIQ